MKKFFLIFFASLIFVDIAVIQNPDPKYDIFFVLAMSVFLGLFMCGTFMLGLFSDPIRHGSENDNIRKDKEATEYKEFLEEEAKYSREYEGLNKKQKREKFKSNYETFLNRKRQNEKEEKNATRIISEEKEWVVCALQFGSEPLSFINDLIEGFGGQAIATQKLEKLLDELLKEEFIKVDDEATSLNQSVCVGDWYALTEKGREILDEIEKEMEKEYDEVENDELNIDWIRNTFIN